MASQPSRSPATTVASAVSPRAYLPSHGPRTTAPVASPSSGKNSSQLPPYPMARPQVTSPISTSARRVERASRVAAWKARNTT